MRKAAVLWGLMGLFLLRVLGQLLVELFDVSFLPPSPEWFSGALPYGPLLASQLLILALMTKVGVDFTRHAGWSYTPRLNLGRFLMVFGATYLAVMNLRYILRMSLYPQERWFGGAIPIVFHWVLSSYVLIWGWHHWRNGPGQPLSQNWAWRLARLTGGGALVLAVGAWVLLLLLPSLLARELDMRAAEFAVRIERGIGFRSSDGVELVADVFHPLRAGPKTPTILVRIPYSKNLVNHLSATIVGQMWAERGYTVVLQGTRGRYESGGRYVPFKHERQDGIETLQWLSRQPWYDGHVGMWGGSYFGYTQWVLADQVDPGPRALLVQEASTDFQHMFRPGGAFSLQSALYWAVMSHGPEDNPPSQETLARGLHGWPLIEADQRAATDIPFFNDWVRHEQSSEYWDAVDGNDRARRSRAPALLMAGWYDPFLPSQLQDFVTLHREASPHVSGESRLIVGPWAHAMTVTLPSKPDLRNYRLEGLAPSLEWFDRHLKGKPRLSTAPVLLYVMGRDRWREEPEWPLARARNTPYYLRSDGNANTADGDGFLSEATPPGDEPPDEFVYDPERPVPSAGGAMLGPLAAVARQNEVESRKDVLVYSTAQLSDDVEVTGPIQLVLYVSTTAPATDFTGKLVDVWPDGSAWNVSEGIVRRPYASEGAAPTEIRIDLWPTSMVFLRGHQIRLEVSSSSFPRFDRHPNTAGPIETEVDPESATQTVHHSAVSPSRLVLPVIPQ